MLYRIEVYYREDIPDAEGQGIVGDAADLGISGIEDVRTARLYWITGDLDTASLDRICSELLADAVTQLYSWEAVESHEGPPEASGCEKPEWTVDVRYRPGVTDAVGDSVMKGIRDMGIEGAEEVHTGHRYTIRGAHPTRSEMELLSKRLLANELVQEIEVW